MEKNEALEKIISWFESQNLHYHENNVELKSKFVFTHNERYEIHLKCISWKELLDINAKSFAKNSEGNYFNSEKQKRLIISQALEKIIDLDTKEIYSKSLIDKLSYEIVEIIWNEYQSVLHLSAEEVNLIYSSTQNYFNGNEEYYPVLPEILEIDYILKGIVSLSRSEFNSLTNKEFEIMQLVIAVKNEIKKSF